MENMTEFENGKIISND